MNYDCLEPKTCPPDNDLPETDCENCDKLDRETIDILAFNGRGMLIKYTLCVECLDVFIEETEPAEMQQIFNQAIIINQFFDDEDYCFNIISEDVNGERRIIERAVI